MKTLEPRKSGSLESMAFDLFLLAAGFIFLTGGGFLIQGRLADLAGQKPWLHRGAVSALTLLVLVWAGLREAAVQNGKTRRSFIFSWLASLKLTPASWTLVLFALSAEVWGASAWLRHDVLHSSFDLAIFAQAVWNTAHGAFLYSSIKGGICLLGDHFSPLLALFALPYAVWPDPRNLLLLQAIAAASSIFPVYLLARKKCPALALSFAAAFVLYLPVRNAVRFDFHPEVAAMPLFLWAYYFLDGGKTRKASLFLLLALLSKENAALVTFALGAYAFCFLPGRRSFGLGWMAFSAVYFFAAVRFWIPAFSGQDYAYLSGNFMAWKDQGLSALARQLANAGTVSYLAKIFAPLGWLSLLDPPSLLLTLPMLAQNLISRNEATRSIFFQYTAFLTPFVFISAVEGAARMKSARWLPYYVIAASLLCAGVSELYVIQVTRSYDNAHTRLVRDYLRKIPSNESLRTHEFFAPHAADRKELHIYENQHPREGGSARALAATTVAVDETLLGEKAAADFAQLAAAGYALEFESGTFKVFRKKEAA
ncbi:MAG TPA: DUF2079 domain-containing protein [Verrucomicrobiae bacterium]|nr:DUF2079 domain-containing protein [Verrucomicrobiae bacterium]